MGKRIITSISTSGQITLPAEVRRLLGVKARDKVAIEIDDHDVRILPLKYTLETAAGSVRSPDGTADVDRHIREAMDGWAAEHPFG